MATVYILKGTTGRHYIGSSEDFVKRLEIHQSGRVHTTCRLGLPLTVVSTKECDTYLEAFRLERKLKNMKSPQKAIVCLR